jgi:CheY-like chemotaxis protein
MKKKYRILIADDSPNSRDVMHQALLSDDTIVESVTNGNDALNKILYSINNKQSFDLLVTDISMPQMRGDELIETIRDHKIDIKILAVTGTGDKNLLLKLMRCGIQEYMDKPFRTSELKMRVESILDKKELYKDTQRIDRTTEKPFYNSENEVSTELIFRCDINRTYADEFRAALLGWYESGKTRLIMNFTDTNDIDVTCLSILVTLCTMISLDENKRQITLKNISPDLELLIMSTRLNSIVTIEKKPFQEMVVE